MAMHRQTDKPYSPRKSHNDESWGRILHRLNGASASTMELADAINHKPPRSCRRATQRDTNIAFIEYCQKMGWLT
jgi:hypothetical protein